MRTRSIFLLAVAGLGLAAAGLGWRSVVRIDGELTERFRQHHWDFPSRILSDIALLYPGQELVAARLDERLPALGYRPASGPPKGRGEVWKDPQGNWWVRRADPRDDDAPGRTLRIEVKSGRIERIVDTESGREAMSLELGPALLGGLFGTNWQERRVLALDEFPPLLIRAVLDVEDQRFFEHRGLDLAGIARAMLTNLRHGGVVQGGSTLTQQLVKNFFLTSERRWSRKLREALMAILLERRFRKEEILGKYLNEIYLGQRGAQGIHGMAEAARFYFGRLPRELEVAEIALLAGLIRGPNLYSPLRNETRARARRGVVLAILERNGRIDADTRRLAEATPLPQDLRSVRAREAPFFTDLVVEELAETYPEDLLTSEGLRIETFLDPWMQEAAEEAVSRGLAALEERHPHLRRPEPGRALQACLLAIQPQTGAIRALVGGRDYATSQFNRCLLARRQPGSVFKPIVLAAALEATRHGDEPLHPRSTILDEPFTWSFDGQSWAPSNAGGSHRGRVRVREAMELSLNAATARLAHDVGLPAIFDMARLLGIESPLPPVPAVVLGAAEVTPLEIARTYATLANSGLRTEPRAIRRVLDRSGVALERREMQVTRALPADTAFLVTHVLAGVLENGTGRGVRQGGFRAAAAGKTGTSNDSRDAWFAGYTPELAVVVWVGFDEPEPLGLGGGQAAVPLWTAFVRRVLDGNDRPAFLPPPGVRLFPVDPGSGGLAGVGCPERVVETFREGDPLPAPCPLHDGSASVAPGHAGLGKRIEGSRGTGGTARPWLRGSGWEARG